MKEQYRLAIVGSRGFNDYNKLVEILNILQSKVGFGTIVSGGAGGADGLGARYAHEANIPLIEHIPEWTRPDGTTNRGAGYARNVDIWNDSDYGIAFWDGKSKGTSHSFEISTRQNKKLYIYNYIENIFYVHGE